MTEAALNLKKRRETLRKLANNSKLNFKRDIEKVKPDGVNALEKRIQNAAAAKQAAANRAKITEGIQMKLKVKANESREAVKQAAANKAKANANARTKAAADKAAANRAKANADARAKAAANKAKITEGIQMKLKVCLLYTSPSPRDRTRSRMPSSA